MLRSAYRRQDLWCEQAIVYSSENSSRFRDERLDSCDQIALVHGSEKGHGSVIQQFVSLLDWALAVVQSNQEGHYHDQEGSACLLHSDDCTGQ